MSGYSEAIFEHLRDCGLANWKEVESGRVSASSIEGVDPLAVSIAGQDEGEYIVQSIDEGKKKTNKTVWYFKVKFDDGSEDWLPYMGTTSF